MGDIIFTDKNFEDEVEKSRLPVLVDFWAAWCAPCRIQGPIVEELAKDYEGKVKIGKLNVDENQNASLKYGIMSIPTIAIFEDGKVTKTMIGLQSKDNLKKDLDNLS